MRVFEDADAFKAAWSDADLEELDTFYEECKHPFLLYGSAETREFLHIYYQQSGNGSDGGVNSAYWRVAQRVDGDWFADRSWTSTNPGRELYEPMHGPCVFISTAPPPVQVRLYSPPQTTGLVCYLHQRRPCFL